MKKFIGCLLIIVLLLSLTACSNQKPAEQSKQEEPKVAEKIVLRIGMTAEADSHYGKGLLQFKEKLEKYSENKVAVKIFPSSQLGNERDLIEGVGAGTIEMCISSTGPLPNFSSNFMLFDLPFIVTDRQKAYQVMDGSVGQEILATLEPKGIKALGFWENGFRNITNNKAPIVHPADVKGMKIRTMENPVHIETFKLLGAYPTPMAWGEVFTSLQQGTIDGQENPLVILDTAKVYEVQKHVSLTGHFYSPSVIMINKKLLDGFPKDIQEAVFKAEKEAREWERNYSSELDKSLVKALTEKGMVVTEVDKMEWQQAVSPVYDKYLGKINPEYIKALTGK
ncbi:MAG: C4-dicarboxylate ABC transporter substrate-binding protein [Peptococcaceae bacterium BICA1-8]|nr:MAG: C4-dicarboxylate ABC transporter substrate-binding protein [Peptococcaceae bacterium BICA1-8]